MMPHTESMPAPAASATGTHPAVFRNNPLFLTVILLLGVLFAFFCLCALLLTVSAFSELMPLSVDSIYAAVASVFMTLSCALMSLWLFSQTRLMAYAHAQLNAAGIEFHYGSKRSPRSLFLPWAEISTIYTWRLPHGQAYRVETSSDNYAEFSSYTFFRPKKLAALIVQRTGCPIERMAK